MAFDLTDYRQTVKSRIDALLLEEVQGLPDVAPELKAAMEYALLVGGKRMRPLLVNLIGDCLGVAQQDIIAISKAIECIHAYSLVHDDLPAMDDDDLRRGQPTCHIKFNEATAILAGDALQTLAFDILANAELSQNGHHARIKLVSLLVKASGYQGMCGGQAIDLASTGITIDIHQLKLLHRLKTGALLRACVDMVTAVSPDLPQAHIDAFSQFADAIGLAFQVQDDILDVVADTEQLGKPQGSDEENGKNTFPALLGLEMAREELANLHSQALQALQSLPYNTHSLEAFCDLMVNRTH